MTTSLRDDPLVATAARSAIAAIVGRRPEQQDAARIEAFRTQAGEPALLLLVADGMGGHAGGQLASGLAIETFATAFLADGRSPLASRLHDALERANEAIGARTAADRQLKGMGCTLVAAVLAGNRLAWVSVGDSLLLGVKDRRLYRFNADHSLAPELERAVIEGRMTRQEADESPERSLLRSALTGGRIAMIDEGERQIAPGVLVLLASDGLLTLAEDSIARIASGGKPASATIERLLAAVQADMPPDQDNATLVAAYCEGNGGVDRGRPWLRRRIVGMSLLLLAFSAVSAAAVIMLGEQFQESPPAAVQAKPVSVSAGPPPPPPPAARRNGPVDGTLFDTKKAARTPAERPAGRPTRPPSDRAQDAPATARPSTSTSPREADRERSRSNVANPAGKTQRRYDGDDLPRGNPAPPDRRE